MWVVNAEGVYIENRPYHSYLENDILTAINEKYGTNFSRLTYLREPSIAIGDDCPNWDAYEKIELPDEKVIISDGKYYLISLEFNNPQSNYMLGLAYEDGDNFALEPSEDGNDLVLYNKEGVRVGTETPDWNILIETIHNSIMEYNGQSVWIERNSSTPLNPNTWERIP